MSHRPLFTILASALLAGVLTLTGSTALAAGPGGAPLGPPVVPPPVPKQDRAKVAAAAAAANAIAPAVPEAGYVPITPCRIVDTREGSGTNGTKFGSSTTRSYRVAGTAGFEAQGGKAGGCGVPATAVAISVNAVMVSPSKAGSVRIWPAGPSTPATSFLNYGAFTMSGSGIVTVTPGNTASNITVKNYSSSTNLVLDVSGYYLPKIAGMIGPGNVVYSGTGIVSVSNSAPGVYQVVVDRDVAYCTPMVNTYNAGPGVYGAAYTFNNNRVTVYTWYLDGTTHREVSLNFYAYLTVDC